MVLKDFYDIARAATAFFSCGRFGVLILIVSFPFFFLCFSFVSPAL